MNITKRLRRRAVSNAVWLCAIALTVATVLTMPFAVSKYAAQGVGSAKARVAAFDPDIDGEIPSLSTNRAPPNRIFVSRIHPDYNLPKDGLVKFDNRHSEVAVRNRLWAQYPATWKTHAINAAISEFYHYALDPNNKYTVDVAPGATSTFHNNTNPWNGCDYNCQHLSHIMNWLTVHPNILNDYTYRVGKWEGDTIESQQNPHLNGTNADPGIYDATQIGSSYWFNADLHWEAIQID